MFKSPDQALRFAFRTRESSVISIPSASYIADKTDNESNSDRLTKYDLHAQAGMIFSFLSRRPEIEQAYAFYLHGAIGEQEIAAKLLAEKIGVRLQKYNLSLSQLTTAILGKSVRDVRDRANMTHWKAYKFRGELADALAPVQNSLLYALDEWLQASED